jgi:hypothetical protein
MKDLSPEARSLLTAARASGVPTVARRHNIKHTVLLRAAAVTAASAGAGAVGATSLMAKLLLAGILASAATGGAVGVWKLRGTRDVAVTPSAASARPLHVADKNRPSQASAQGQDISVPTERPRATNLGREPARSFTGRTPVREANRESQPNTLALAPPASAERRLQDEVAQLRHAHEALRNGNPALALKILADYDRDFPKGALTEERGAIAAIASCQSQPGSSVRAQAQAFLRSAPSSLLGERVRAACFADAKVSPK